MSLSNNHLINVVRFVSTYLPPPYLDHGVFARDEATGSTEAALTPEISALIKDSDMIVGQQYYDAKVPPMLLFAIRVFAIQPVLILLCPILPTLRRPSY